MGRGDMMKIGNIEHVMKHAWIVVSTKMTFDETYDSLFLAFLETRATFNVEIIFEPNCANRLKLRRERNSLKSPNLNFNR